VELAVLAALLIFVIGYLINLGMNYNRSQDMNMRAFRNSLAMAYTPLVREHSRNAQVNLVEYKPGIDAGNPLKARTYSPQVSGASSVWTNKLYYDYDVQEFDGKLLEKAKKIVNAYLDLPQTSYVMDVKRRGVLADAPPPIKVFEIDPALEEHYPEVAVKLRETIGAYLQEGVNEGLWNKIKDRYQDLVEQGVDGRPLWLYFPTASYRLRAAIPFDLAEYDIQVGESSINLNIGNFRIHKVNIEDCQWMKDLRDKIADAVVNNTDIEGNEFVQNAVQFGKFICKFAEERLNIDLKNDLPTLKALIFGSWVWETVKLSDIKAGDLVDFDWDGHEEQILSIWSLKEWMSNFCKILQDLGLSGDLCNYITSWFGDGGALAALDVKVFGYVDNEEGAINNSINSMDKWKEATGTWPVFICDAWNKYNGCTGGKYVEIPPNWPGWLGLGAGVQHGEGLQPEYTQQLNTETNSLTINRDAQSDTATWRVSSNDKIQQKIELNPNMRWWQKIFLNWLYPNIGDNEGGLVDNEGRITHTETAQPKFWQWQAVH